MKTSIDIKGRSLLVLNDLSDEEMCALVELAVELKQRKQSGIRGNLLERKNVVMLFEKMSTRTRCATAVAAADEGGQTEFLAGSDIHLEKKESVADTAMVLGKMFDGIMFRGFKQSTVEQLSEHSGIPVWNALTDQSHPTQALADLMTIKEVFGNFDGLTLMYTGDGRNNVANSLMMGCVKSGINFINCTPKELTPDPALIKFAENIATTNGSSVSVVHEPAAAAEGVNIVYTDVWVSMGEESKKEERIGLLRPYQVNMELMKATGNLENGKLLFLHCLPAFHDSNTDVSKDSGALEVTDDVFKAPFSKVFEQAENRLHTIKALMVATI
ncbi:MAG: ornithine carbamoyltransferase [Kiritimatiellae bacterium]|nr:ornithine carbamoyltransferase [Kiritimatiellia bacterium]